MFVITPLIIFAIIISSFIFFAIISFFDAIFSSASCCRIFFDGFSSFSPPVERAAFAIDFLLAGEIFIDTDYFLREISLPSIFIAVSHYLSLLPFIYCYDIEIITPAD